LLCGMQHGEETFRILCEDDGSGARRGSLKTPHGVVETPVFMPVGTQATVKATTPETLERVGAQIILGNTYHLNLRPGSELIRELGGLHQFMGWDKPILTDSGGFQVFSLSALREITDAGVHFKSHLDGAPVFMGPREAFRIQENLSSDIAMTLDECPPHTADEAACREAVRKTLLWAREFKREAEASGFLEKGHLVFGIAQGAQFPELRRRCSEALVEMDFSGYAVGGVSVGEPEEAMLEQVKWNVPLFPRDKPRYVMGVGTPPQLLKMIRYGADMFDCVMPTRAARHGTAYTDRGPINLKNERWKRDPAPLMEGIDNYTCRHFSRAYLRHLVTTNEPLGGMLLTLHNLHFYQDLMVRVRAHIEAGDYESWHREWIAGYEAASGV